LFGDTRKKLQQAAQSMNSINIVFRHDIESIEQQQEHSRIARHEVVVLVVSKYRNMPTEQIRLNSASS